MTTTVITEEMPSSGTTCCQHQWQVIREDANSMTLVCGKSGCSASKVVPKPRVQESCPAKPVLFG